MADCSFDIVSKVDRQEVDNALNQAAKEISQRYDFKGVGASIAWCGREASTIEANTEERVKAVARRLPVQAGQARDLAEGAGRRASRSRPARSTDLAGDLKEGISQDNAKKVAKIIRDEGPKGVKAQVQGDELRVTSKSRDDLQAVIAAAQGQGPRLRAAVRQLPLTTGRRGVPTGGGDPLRLLAHQVSTYRVGTSAGGDDDIAVRIHCRVSTGSITSSSSKWTAALSALLSRARPRRGPRRALALGLVLDRRQLPAKPSRTAPSSPIAAQLAARPRERERRRVQRAARHRLRAEPERLAQHHDEAAARSWSRPSGTCARSGARSRSARTRDRP